MPFQVYQHRHTGWNPKASTKKDLNSTVLVQTTGFGEVVAKGIAEGASKLAGKVLDHELKGEGKRQTGKVVKGDLRVQGKVSAHDEAQVRALDDMDSVSKDYDQLLASFGNHPKKHLSNADRRKMIESNYVPDINTVNAVIEESEGVRLIQTAHANATRNKNKLFAIYK
jgi:hypothetical protein